MRLHASLDFILKICIQLQYYLKFTQWHHAAPCISRLYLKGLRTVPVVFEVETVALCCSMQLHGAPCSSMRLHAAPCSSLHF